MLKYSPVIKEGIPKLKLGSRDHTRYWSTQMKYCLEGYKPHGGVHIPGAYYFYLNFYKILAHDEKTNRKTLTNPWYRDMDHIYFDTVYQCKADGTGMVVLKARDKGFSYMNSALILYEWLFYRNNEVGVGAPSPAYVSSFRRKIINGWNALPKEIQPRKDLADNELKMISGYTIKENGVWVEKGFKSIIHYRCMDNPDMFRGERLGMMIFEEAGEFKDLVRAYMASEACFRDGALQFGVPIIGGTSNSMNKSDDFMEMFYNHEKYNLKQVFIPASKVFYGFFNKKTGISDEEGAKKHLEEKRNLLRAGKDKTAYYLHIQEYPLVPEDAFMQANKSPFDLELINNQIARITASKALKNQIQTGDLDWTDGTRTKVRWTPNPMGLYRILYHPKPEMANLDIGAVDSYTQETAPNSDSKGCALIYRRFFMSDDEPSEMVVAEYTDRPYKKKDWYDGCHKLAAYYHSEMLVEYTDEGFFNYFIENNATKYLKRRPASADSVWSKVSNKYGVHMKAYQKNLIIDLMDDYIKERCEDIYFISLLKELAVFGLKNTDRAMTFGMALLHDSDNSNIMVKRIDENEKQDDYLLPTYKNVGGRLIAVNSRNRGMFNRDTDPLGLLNR